MKFSQTDDDISDTEGTSNSKRCLSSDSDDEIILVPKKRRIAVIDDDEEIETSQKQFIDGNEKIIEENRNAYDSENNSDHENHNLVESSNEAGGKGETTRNFKNSTHKSFRKLRIVLSDEDSLDKVIVSHKLSDSSQNLAAHSDDNSENFTGNLTKKPRMPKPKKQMMLDRLKELSEKKRKKAKEEAEKSATEETNKSANIETEKLSVADTEKYATQETVNGILKNETPVSDETNSTSVDNQHENATLKPTNFDDEIFDAEDSEDGNHKSAESKNVEEDLLEYEKELDKLNTKKPKPKQPRKVRENKREKQKELMEIYSENQRLLRQSSVQLPYIVPPERTLDEFLRDLHKEPVFQSKRPFKRDKISMLSPEAELKYSECDKECNKNVQIVDDWDIDLNLEKNSKIGSDVFELNKQSNDEYSCLIEELVLKVEMNLSKTDLSKRLADLLTNDDHSANLDSNSFEKVPDSNELEMKNDNQVYKPLSERISIEMNASNVLERNENADDKDVDFISLKQRIIQAAKSYTPRLSGSTNGMIFLDDDPTQEHVKSDMELFVEKFVQHTKEISRVHVAQDVKLNIVSKVGSQEELEVSELHVSIPVREKETIFEKPGLKFLKLKNELCAKIFEKKKARLEHKKNLEIIDENEILEEEEAELTDESDTEPEIDENEDPDEEESEDEEVVVPKSKKRKRNAFIDDEASDSHEGSPDENSDSDTKTSKDSVGSSYSFSGIFSKASSNLESEQNSQFNQHTLETQLLSNKKSVKHSRLILYDSESEDAENIASLTRKNNSFEISCSAIPSYQPDRSIQDTKNDSSINDTTIQCGQATKNEFDEEDIPSQECNSQPLFSSQNEKNDIIITSTPNLAGLLSQNSPSQGCIEDLLPLCSGSFPDSQFKIPASGGSCSEKSEVVSSASSQFESQSLKDNFLESYAKRFLASSSNFSKNSHAATEDSMVTTNSEMFKTVYPERGEVTSAIKDLCFPNSQSDIYDLVGMCSGTFSSRTSVEIKSNENFDNKLSSASINDSPLKVTNRKRVVPLSPDHDNDIDDSDENEQEITDDLLDTNDDALVRENIEGDEEMDVNGFIEDEAELSGSDVGSDAEEDELDDNQNLEDLIGDEEMPSEDVLRDQIGRVHMKKLMDEDKRSQTVFGRW